MPNKRGQLIFVPEQSQFGGRHLELQVLHNAMTTSQSLTVIDGNEPFGKSALAAYYVRRYRQDYEHVIWLDASDKSDLRELCEASMGYLTVFPVITEPLSDFVKWLKANQHWLLVLDNVASASLVQDFVSRETLQKGNVLITTRLNLTYESITLLHLGALPPHEAQEILLCCSGIVPSPDKIPSLAGSVKQDALFIAKAGGYMPGPLMQVVAYMQRERCSIGKCCQMVRSGALQL